MSKPTGKKKASPKSQASPLKRKADLDPLAVECDILGNGANIISMQHAIDLAQARQSEFKERITELTTKVMTSKNDTQRKEYADNMHGINRNVKELDRRIKNTLEQIDWVKSVAADKEANESNEDSVLSSKPRGRRQLGAATGPKGSGAESREPREGSENSPRKKGDPLPTDSPTEKVDDLMPVPPKRKRTEIPSPEDEIASNAESRSSVGSRVVVVTRSSLDPSQLADEPLPQDRLDSPLDMAATAAGLQGDARDAFIRSAKKAASDAKLGAFQSQPVSTVAESSLDGERQSDMRIFVDYLKSKDAQKDARDTEKKKDAPREPPKDMADTFDMSGDYTEKWIDHARALREFDESHPNHSDRVKGLTAKRSFKGEALRLINDTIPEAELSLKSLLEFGYAKFGKLGLTKARDEEDKLNKLVRTRDQPVRLFLLEWNRQLSRAKAQGYQLSKQLGGSKLLEACNLSSQAQQLLLTEVCKEQIKEGTSWEELKPDYDKVWDQLKIVQVNDDIQRSNQASAAEKKKDAVVAATKLLSNKKERKALFASLPEKDRNAFLTYANQQQTALASQITQPNASGLPKPQCTTCGKNHHGVCRLLGQQGNQQRGRQQNQQGQRGRSQSRGPKGKGKGKGGKGRGKGNRSQSRAPQGQDLRPKNVCYDFLEGKCWRDNCKYAHTKEKPQQNNAYAATTPRKRSRDAQSDDDDDDEGNTPDAEEAKRARVTFAKRRKKT